MKIRIALFCLASALSSTAVACPTGMVFNGNGCSPPYEYTGWDWLQDQYDAIDAIGADRPRSSPRGLTAEEAADLQRRLKEAEEEKARRTEELANGVWIVDSTPTPEGTLCVATFAKATSTRDEGVKGGLVTLLGFQQPKTDAWLIFQGAGLPAPVKVKKLRITLQQDDEPAQTVEVFNYRESQYIGSVAFAVPGLMAAIEGMRDSQRFTLSLNGKALMSLEWTGGAPNIAELKQCAGKSGPTSS